jgi:hypothetical protein
MKFQNRNLSMMTRSLELLYRHIKILIQWLENISVVFFQTSPTCLGDTPKPDNSCKTLKYVPLFR